VYQGSGQAEHGYGGLLLGLNLFLVMPSSLKNTTHSKVT
jgi:hypothetical protein